MSDQTSAPRDFWHGIHIPPTWRDDTVLNLVCRGADSTFEVAAFTVGALRAVLAAAPHEPEPPRPPRFSDVNLARCTAADGFGHALESWSIAEWTNAMAGEAGEACNLAKKLLRHRDGVAGNKKPEDKDVDSLRLRCAEELADVVIYADLAMRALGHDLNDTVRRVFNRKSDELGAPYKVSEGPLGAASRDEPRPHYHICCKVDALHSGPCVCECGRETKSATHPYAAGRDEEPQRIDRENALIDHPTGKADARTFVQAAEPSAGPWRELARLAAALIKALPDRQLTAMPEALAVYGWLHEHDDRVSRSTAPKEGK